MQKEFLYEIFDGLTPDWYEKKKQTSPFEKIDHNKYLAWKIVNTGLQEGIFTDWNSSYEFCLNYLLTHDITQFFNMNPCDFGRIALSVPDNERRFWITLIILGAELLQIKVPWWIHMFAGDGMPSFAAVGYALNDGIAFGDALRIYYECGGYALWMRSRNKATTIKPPWVGIGG